MIDCIILAGGLGTRLRSVVSDRPKVLAEIDGTPFLDILLAKVRPITKKVILAVGYLGDQIIAKYPGSSFSFEEKPLGTGGAIQKAMKEVRSEHVLILNGDSYLDFDFAPFLDAHLKKKADMTLLYCKVSDASRYGSLRLEGDQIVGFEEKNGGGKEGLINTGVYLFKSELLRALDLGEAFSLEKEAFPLLLQKKCFAVPCNGFFIDIGTPESYKEAKNIFKRVNP